MNENRTQSTRPAAVNSGQRPQISQPHRQNIDEIVNMESDVPRTVDPGHHGLMVQVQSDMLAEVGSRVPTSATGLNHTLSQSASETLSNDSSFEQDSTSDDDTEYSGDEIDGKVFNSNVTSTLQTIECRSLQRPILSPFTRWPVERVMNPFFKRFQNEIGNTRYGSIFTIC